MPADHTRTPNVPDPDHWRTDAAADQGQDPSRAATQMAEEDMAAASVSRFRGEPEDRADG